MISTVSVVEAGLACTSVYRRVPACPGRVLACTNVCWRVLTCTGVFQRVTPGMEDFLQRLRRRVRVGVVGGSDFIKIKEQLGDDEMNA
uniref:Phosphomannomutase n=1 Tax=Salmo trutta TaxID=8032 RepID=A0A673ZWG4_SALTR